MTDEPTVPAVQALHLVELVKRWDVTAADLLRGASLNARDLRDPRRRLTVRELVALVERARALTGEPALGVYFGLRMQVTSHGYLGFAAMITGALTLRVAREGSEASLVIEEEADFGPARDAVLLALLVGLRRMGCALTGRARGRRSRWRGSVGRATGWCSTRRRWRRRCSRPTPRPSRSRGSSASGRWRRSPRRRASRGGRGR